MQGEEWVRRIEEAGLGLFAIPLLEAFRALGFVAAHALMLGQPLLTGLIDESTLQATTSWLEEPQQVEQLIRRLEGKA